MSDWRDNLPKPAIGSIEVGDGWRPLVEYGYNLLKDYPCLSAAQIKEKFGGLRFYVDHDYEHGKCKDVDEWYEVEQILECLSLLMCEQCGAYGKQRTGGWVKTLCDSCHSKHEADRIGHKPVGSDTNE